MPLALIPLAGAFIVFFYGKKIIGAHMTEGTSSVNTTDAKRRAVSESDINGNLPRRVFVATLTQTFSRGWEFCLSDGKIMIKKAGSENWALFQGTGLPFPKKRRIAHGERFDIPKKIVEIAADDDMLLAFDDEKKMFVCPIASNRVDKKFVWTNGFGWPEKKQLVQNDLVAHKRGWATGTRRSSIEWYTDRFGNEHNWGTMGVTTVYFLSENGREIRFTDSGLPTDLSDTILGPERGSFTAQNISASGSTLFLIGDDGTMYTRLIDYDTMGSDPMFFKYTYVAEKQRYKGSDYRSNFTRWGLPNEDWRKQPDIKLSGNARLSKYICIFQNGKGNDARVLRVAGTDSAGKAGFYYKNLTDSEWRFEPYPLVLSPAAFLSGAKAEAEKKNEYSYVGTVAQNGKTINGVICSVSDMTLTSEGSCTLAVKSGGEEKSIPLYLVTMWTYMTRYNPVFDGTPKSFFATPHFSEADISAQNKTFDALLHGAFGGKNLDLFSATATAWGPYLIFTFGKKPNEYTISLRATKASEAEFKKEMTASRVQTQSLRILDTAKTYTASDVPLLDSIRQENENAIAEADAQMKTYLKDAARSELSRWGYNIFDTIAAVTMLNRVDVPKIKTMTSFGGQLMAQNADNFKFISMFELYANPYKISAAQNIIDECTSLKNRIAETGSAKTDPFFKNTYGEYLDALHIPDLTYGTVTYKKKRYETTIRRISASLPALRMEYADETNAQSVIIEFPSLIDDIKKGRDPFTASVVFRAISGSGSAFIKTGIRSYIMSRTGTYTWDGKEAKIEVNKSLNKRLPLFAGMERK
ncbi:hypothetical protein HMPREF0860_0649 [Treponema socranskii subsp. socranskii VPI DR56BR1116 = ATCC 35536]|uniref:Uncharacterized protein n=1 Tax=Treponema socranskii subsp. socranskii VPI DR56BR1116 = ATCC 35536 TaxID=1125725 RepID=U1GSW3_TRESO|nr:hypothetical protein HMPREF1325_1621 [Treponema socranskii subsp. socranskii VPI DR56BR1116 = ATCC 35536]ERK05050.1 hypothetical protein HMPREF0860_0649 [Treponema socranskii subsp. socranskii VPI DR56BR1116 = ATCC 35536]